MTELDKLVMLQHRPKDALADFTYYIEDMIIKGRLDLEQQRALKTKVKFWWLIAYGQGLHDNENGLPREVELP